MLITNYSGIHESNRKDTNVNGIWITDTNTKYIPNNLGHLFNLSHFWMWRTQLIEIEEHNFKGMEKLQLLELYDNELSSLPSNSFNKLLNLRTLSLRNNQIEELQNGLFTNNLNLDTIYLQFNKIKFIGSNLFNKLTRLNTVSLWDNVCINQDYTGSTKMMELKDDIKINCLNPTEVIPTASESLKVIDNYIIDLLEEVDKSRQQQTTLKH